MLSYFNVNLYINILLHYFVDYVNIDNGERNYHKRQKRSVPSTSFTIEMAVYCDADFMTNDLHPTSTSDRVTAMLVKYNAVSIWWCRNKVLRHWWYTTNTECQKSV